jgi:hypothetical protein
MWLISIVDQGIAAMQHSHDAGEIFEENRRNQN